jgi:hypothetical protein
MPRRELNDADCWPAQSRLYHHNCIHWYRKSNASCHYMQKHESSLTVVPPFFCTLHDDMRKPALSVAMAKTELVGKALPRECDSFSCFHIVFGDHK